MVMVVRKGWPVFFLLVILLFSLRAAADLETLNVATCSGVTCNVAGLNSDDLSQDGATIAKGSTLTTTWSNTVFPSGSVINNVDFVITRGGDAGIAGVLTITMRNAAATTTYCTFTPANIEADTKLTIDTDASCSWTKGRLDDLVITVNNGDPASPDNAYISFMDMNITYTPPDTTPPTISLNSPANNSWDLDGLVTFEYTPADTVGFGNCSLYLDGALNTTNTSINSGQADFYTPSTLSDGIHPWYVSCTDSSANTNTSVTHYVRVDTNAPIVHLESPADANISTQSSILFYYNASDAQTTLASCELIINDSIQETTFLPAEDTTLSFSAGLTNGYYLWWVNCTDANGFEGMSVQRGITINTTLPSISFGASSYRLGQTALLSGENFNNSVSITINYTLPNGTILSNMTTSSASGAFTDYFPLGYGYPIGTYSALAYESADVLQNASVTFSAILPPTALFIDPPYGQGDAISITGSSYPPSTTVNITLTFNDSSTDSFLIASNSSGGFLAMYNLSYSAPLDLATIFGRSITYSQINASTTFSIEQRAASLQTDLATYMRDENVNIFGYNFTRNGLVSLAMYDNTTDDIGASFPVNKSSDVGGDFSHQWNTLDTCNGVYRIEALDHNNSFLNDTHYFTIEETVSANQLSLPTAGAKFVTSRTVFSAASINQSENIDETLTSNTKSTWYYEINFTNSFNPSLTVENVDFYFEHADNGLGGGLGLQYWNGSQYVGYSCPTLSSGAIDHTDTCDITSAFSSASDLNTPSLRVSFTKTSGGSSTWSVDYAYLNITTSYQPACTYFNGTPGGGLQENPPFITSLLLEDNILSPLNELDLGAGATREIFCNVSVSDGDGYTDIQQVNATLYSTTVSAGSPDAERNHYTNSSCVLANGVGSQANYTCTFNVYYYAINGTWECLASVSDDGEIVTSSDSSTINPLYALNITPALIDYGDFELGQQSLEQEANITNIGNVRINVSAYGYGSSVGDGLAMNCDQNNISIDLQRYALTSGVSFATKSLVSSTLQTLNLFIDPQQSPGPVPENQTFWQLEASGPAQPQGVCNGVLVFQAEAE